MRSRSLVYLIFITWLSSIDGQPILYNGSIIDKHSKKPIPYATVFILHSEKGTYSDEEGRFELKAKKIDTLVISAFGYRKELIPANQLSKFIEIQASEIELKEVTVTPSKKRLFKLSLGFHSKKRNGAFRDIPQAALKIPNPTQRIGIIKQAQFSVEKRLLNKKENLIRRNYRIRIRIQAITESGTPGQDLTDRQLIYDVDENQKKIKVQFHEFIPFPSEGCFIGLEFLGHITDENVFVPFNTTTSQIPHLASSFSNGHDHPFSWIKKGASWIPLDQPIRSGFANFNFGIEVEFP